MLLDFVNNIVFRTYGTNTLDLNFKYSNKVENYFNKPKNGSVLFASPACNSEFDTWANFCKYEGFNEETPERPTQDGVYFPLLRLIMIKYLHTLMQYI